MTDQATIVTTVMPIRATENGDKATLRAWSFGKTDRGRVRENNEDHFLVAELNKAMRVQDGSTEDSIQL